MRLIVEGTERQPFHKDWRFGHRWKTPPLHGPDSDVIRRAQENPPKKPKRREVETMDDFARAFSEQSLYAVRMQHQPESPPEPVLAYFREHPDDEEWVEGPHRWVKRAGGWNVAEYWHFEQLRPKIDAALDTLFASIEAQTGQETTLDTLFPDLQRRERYQVMRLDKVPDHYWLAVGLPENGSIHLGMIEFRHRPSVCSHGTSREQRLEYELRHPEYTELCPVGAVKVARVQ